MTARLPAAAADDAALMAAVTELVNEAYHESERGLWRDDTARTSLAEIVALTQAGELVADLRDGDLAGVVRVQALDAATGEFGMLAAAPARHGQGVGGTLVRFAEDDCRTRGLTTMQLELLVPRGWRLASKERLHGWYTRLGYRLERIGRLEEQYPALAPLLAGPADYRVYAKPRPPAYAALREPYGESRARAHCRSSRLMPVDGCRVSECVGVVNGGLTGGRPGRWPWCFRRGIATTGPT